MSRWFVTTGDWVAGKRHGQGFCKFADGIKFRGEWEDDGWVQSAADPARCKVLPAPGLCRAVAGVEATFTIEVLCHCDNGTLRSHMTLKSLTPTQSLCLSQHAVH